MGRSSGKLGSINKDKVSIIIPTCNRYITLKENINNIIQNQTYKNFEIIVCDDSSLEEYKKNNEDILKFCNDRNVKYFYVARFDKDGVKDYGLARARNFGIINSIGEFLIFLDDRLTFNSNDAIKIFLEEIKKNKKTWIFGDKGAQKEAFVENFSCIKRQEIVDAGMFFERIDKYGAMSRELIGRFARQGFKFKYIPNATARQLAKSSGWDKKEKDIEEMKNFLSTLWAR